MYAGLSQGTAKVAALSKLNALIQGQVAIDAMAYSIYVNWCYSSCSCSLNFIYKKQKKKS